MHSDLVPDPSCRLWYRRPARDWYAALPLGNGRLGAMVHGGIAREVIQLNEESLWDGSHQDRVNPQARATLGRMRDLLFAGRNAEAAALIGEHILDRNRWIDSYQTAGGLWFDWVGEHTTAAREVAAFDPSEGDLEAAWYLRTRSAYGYHRHLDLAEGIAASSCTFRGVRQTRETFCSAVDQVVVTRTAFDRGRGDVDLSLQREADVLHRGGLGADRLVLRGRLPRGNLDFALVAEIRHEGGSLTLDGAVARIRGADAVEVRLALATAWVAPGDASADPLQDCLAVLDRARGKTWADLRADHVRDHRRLFDRVRLDLPASPGDALPTDERLARVRAGAEDPGLEALHFHYGRYLLMGASRPGGLPANLQGVWCHQLFPAWESDYHTNINLQMNYWPSGPANLSECQEPLVRWLELTAPFGADVARRLYDCDGWVLHHISDIHGTTEPMNGDCGLWPMGGVWLCAHLMEHMRFTGDLDFLRERAWPLLRGCAAFVLDFLVEAPPGSACPGKLVTCPSHSPENTFVAPDGTASMFTYAATMDLQLVRGLFADCREAADLLGLSDDPLLARISDAQARLPEVRISARTGRIQEWIEDYAEVEPGHRHISHLYGLHPAAQITRSTPDLLAAARKTIDARLAQGGGHTGWSKAWLMNMLARLGDGDAARSHLLGLLREKTLANLFDDHPPFQIDGNYGACAAVAEMLLQSHDGGILDLLPALPAAWHAGSVRGLRARGGITVDLRWEEGRLAGAVLTADRPRKVRVRCREQVIVVALRGGAPLRLDASLTAAGAAASAGPGAAVPAAGPSAPGPGG